MARLSELLSGNPDKEKALSTLKNLSRRKKEGAAAPHSVHEMAQRKPSLLDQIQIEFVAIDVETTGLDSKSDRVIEIGAVKFKGNAMEGEFSSLVNPGVALPDPIVQLTGITTSEVAAAQPFASVADELLAFIGHRPLCGHQIDFDISFLNEELKRIGKPKLGNPEVDTALLSRIFLSSAERFSLKHVASTLGVSLEHAHRALADARASGQVACSLFSMVETLPVSLRSAMAHFAPHSFLKTLLFKSMTKSEANGEFAFLSGAPERQHKKLTNPSVQSEIPPEAIKKIFGAGGSLVELGKGFSERPSQTQMALSVAEAFNAKAFLIAEAGTGTGKSLAYLIPAALFAVKNDTRVLVSTHTRNLQDQLISKDLPTVKMIAGDGFRYSVLKGRSNYLCVRRFFLLLSGDLMDLSYRERMGILPLLRWVSETKTGDIEEQSQFNIKWFSRVWRMICADAHLCAGKQCAEFSRCFLQAARMRALAAHIVVINHALFYSEICSESSFLGPLGACIFDEAHHLESSGHKHLRVEVDTNRFMQFIDNLSSIDKESKKSESLDFTKDDRVNLKPVIKRLRSEVRAFLEAVDAWVDGQHPPSPEFQIGYDQAALSPLGSYASLLDGLSALQDELNHFVQLHASGEEAEKENSLRPQLRLIIDKTSQLKFDLSYVVAALTEDHVFWIEGNRKKGWVKLCGVALDIGAILSRLWEQNGSACIFTSATLSIGGSMDYFRRKIGLAGVSEAKTRCELFKSPFSPSQMLSCSLSAAPDPDDRDYPRSTADVISSIMTAFQKNILVLFTSHSMLEAVYSCCRNLPFSGQCTILAQGISGARQTILDEFKNSRPCVLLGADSFWEGIDVPGATCEIVIIARLPFQIPTHPLNKALADRIQKEEGESFLSYSVPEAVIKFRQGTGRLIRDRNDRGILLVLDKRITTKNYGARFSAPLGGNIKSFASTDELLGGIEAFFSDATQQDLSSPRYVPFEEV
jgi:ATP-dependent DNA helicase DinG